MIKDGSKILIIQTAFLGDVILTLPVVQNIKEILPPSVIDFLCIPQTESVLKNNPLINELIVYDKRGKKKISGLFKVLSIVKQKKYDLIICPHRSFRSAVITHFTGANYRIGFDKNSLSNLLTERVVYDSSAHEIERNLDLVRVIPGIKFNEYKKQLKPELYSSEEDKNFTGQLISSFNTAKLITFAPCSKWFTKQLPVEKSADITNALINKGYAVILIGGKEETEYCAELEEKTANLGLLNLCGKLTPLQSKIAVENAKCLISVDSAAAHIGASTETPVIQIFGSTVPAFGFYPLSPKSTVVEISSLTCRPCTDHGRNNCPLKHFKCLNDIDVNKIMEITERMVSKE